MKWVNPPPGELKRMVEKGYSFLLSAYPAPFRQQYQDEMIAVFSDLAEDSAVQGVGPLLYLAAREGFHTSAAILRTQWLNRKNLAGRIAEGISVFIAALFRPDPPDQPDGRTSWRLAILEAGLFVLLGLALVVTSYLPSPEGSFAQGALTVLVALTPVLWLLIGLAHGLPRWAYPAVGCLLGSWFFANFAAHTIAIFLILFPSMLAVWVWAALVDRHNPFLPELIRRWGCNLAANPARLSFGLYGVLPVALAVAFDDAYADNFTAWLVLSVLAMVAGAVGYSRSQKPSRQVGALFAGLTISLLCAFCDHETHIQIHWPGELGAASIFALWAALTLLILAPPLIARLYPHLRQNRSRSSQGG